MRSSALAVIGALGLVAVLAAPVVWQGATAGPIPADAAQTDAIPADSAAADMIRAALGQVGVTTVYDPSYVALKFPGGDVPPDRGVCTDVLVRALRVAHGIDLQAVIHADMKADFRAYPKNWGLTRPDRNIDHRRVPNLQRLFERVGASLAVTSDAAAFRPGDIVTSMLPGNLPHVMIVTDRAAPGGTWPLVVHNIGAGTQVEDALFAFPLTGHYRLTGESLARLRGLQG